jgi:hypothetical protein
MRLNRKQLVGLLIIIALVAACVPKTIVTAPGQKAYKANEIVLRVNELMNVTISAEAQKAIPTDAALVIVRFCVKANKVLAVTADGWDKVVAEAWFAVTSDPLVKPHLKNTYIVAIVAILDGIFSAYRS